MSTAKNEYFPEIGIEQIGNGRYLLGEGPIWDTRENMIYWVEAIGCSNWRRTPGTDDFTQWKMPDLVSSIALREDGRAIVTLVSCFYLFDIDSAHCRLVH